MTATDYRGGHQPFADGPTLDDMTPLFGEDIYEHPEFYLHSGRMERHERESVRVFLSVRGRPDALVTVYRALPPDVPQQINPGDWVALSRAYCEIHAAQTDNPADDWPIVSRTVPAGEIVTGGSDLIEWGWQPRA